jgi:GAF domain-containing protein
VDLPDPEVARRVRTFNAVMFISVFVVSLIALVLALMGPMGWAEAPYTYLAPLFPLSLVPVSLFCIRGAKRGHVEAMARLYVGLNALGIILVTLFFDGAVSPTWVLFLWTIALSGTLLRPQVGLFMALGVLVLYALVWTASAVEIGGIPLYTPAISYHPEARIFYFIAFSLIMILSVALLTYLLIKDVQRAYENLRHTAEDLKEVGRSLESRVEERTELLRRRADQFRAIAEVNRAFSEVQGLTSLLEEAVDLISQKLRFYHTGIFLLDADREYVRLQAASSEGGQRMLERSHKLEVGFQSVVGYAAATARPRVALDVGEDAVWFNNPDLPETRSEVALPLIVRGSLIGVLDVQSREVAAFSEDEIQILSILADNVAAAIEGTRLLEETQHALDQLERYQQMDTVGGWRKALARRNREVAFSYDRVALQHNVDIDDALPFQAAGVTKLQTVQRDGRHFLLAPVRVQEQTVGVLAFEGQRPWTDEEQRLTETVVAQLGLALENARLLESTRLNALQERARSEILQRVRGSVQIDAILRRTAQELGQALQVEHSRIQLIPPGDGEGRD